MLSAQIFSHTHDQRKEIISWKTLFPKKKMNKKPRYPYKSNKTKKKKKRKKY